MSTRQDVLNKQQAIRDFYEKNGRWPSRRSKDKYERKLQIALKNYCHISQISYDLDFDEWARAQGYGTKLRSLEQTFYLLMMRNMRPSYSNSEERKLAKALHYLKMSRPDLYQQLKEVKSHWNWRDLVTLSVTGHRSDKPRRLF